MVYTYTGLNCPNFPRAERKSSALCELSTSAFSVSAGRWQPAGRVSAGQLWRRPGPDHGRLSERPAQGPDRRGGGLQRWACGRAACGPVLCQTRPSGVLSCQ